MWFQEEPSQFSVGQTALSLTCSVIERPHTGLDDCLKILLSCFRARTSVHTLTRCAICTGMVIKVGPRLHYPASKLKSGPSRAEFTQPFYHPCTASGVSSFLWFYVGKTLAVGPPVEVDHVKEMWVPVLYFILKTHTLQSRNYWHKTFPNLGNELTPLSVRPRMSCKTNEFDRSQHQEYNQGGTCDCFNVGR